MENFYVTYDATSEQPRVGLSYNYEVSAPISGTKETLIIVAIMLGSILIAIAVVAIVIYRRKSRQQHLDVAKKFNFVESHDDDPEAEFIESNDKEADTGLNGSTQDGEKENDATKHTKILQENNWA